MADELLDFDEENLELEDFDEDDLELFELDDFDDLDEEEPVPEIFLKCAVAVIVLLLL